MPKAKYGRLLVSGMYTYIFLDVDLDIGLGGFDIMIANLSQGSSSLPWFHGKVHPPGY